MPPPDPVILQSPFGQSPVESRQIPGAVLQIGQIALDRQLLVRHKGLGLQPSPARSLRRFGELRRPSSMHVKASAQQRR
jgi:hypothetical protein